MRRLYVFLAIALMLCLSTAAAAKGRSVTVPLQSQHNSGISGTATLTDNGNGTTTITIHMQGAPESAVEPVMVHEGTCKGTATTIVYPLNDITTGNSKTVVHATLKHLTSGPLYINVHESQQNLPNVVSCGPLAPPYQLPTTGAGGTAHSIASYGLILGLGLPVVAIAGLVFVRRRRMA